MFTYLTIPGFDSSTYNFSGPSGLQKNFPTQSFSLGSFLSSILPLIFYIAAFLSFIWIAWGAFEWIFSGGDKNKIAKARSRITYALIGLVITLLALFISNFAKDALKPKDIHVTPLSQFHLITPVYAVDLHEEYAFGDIPSLGAGTSRLVLPAFSIAATAVVIFLVYGGFRYIMSGGNKDEVGAAQKMITQGIIGFVILILSFIILQLFLSTLFGTNLLTIIGI